MPNRLPIDLLVSIVVWNDTHVSSKGLTEFTLKPIELVHEFTRKCIQAYLHCPTVPLTECQLFKLLGK